MKKLGLSLLGVMLVSAAARADQPTDTTISLSLAKTIAEYLQERPYREVAGILNQWRDEIATRKLAAKSDAPVAPVLPDAKPVTP